MAYNPGSGIVLRSSVLLFVFFLLTVDQVLSQISPGVIPDGTQGETMKINDADTIPQRLSFENWNQFDGPLSTLKIGGGFLYEFAGYLQDEAGKQQMDSADIELDRFGMNGATHFFQSRIQLMF